MLYGWDGAQEIPSALIVVEGHHPSAPERIRAIGQEGAVETAAQKLRPIINGDIAARNATVTDHERRSRQGPDASSDKMCLHVLILP